MGEAESILALMLTPGIGRGAVHCALAAARRAGVPLADLLRGSIRELAAISPALAQFRPESAVQAGTLLQKARERGGVALTSTEAGYPGALATRLGAQAPPLLCLSGNCALLGTPMGAVVGARAASQDGEQLAAACAAAFSEAGVTVVSGGAEGIDSAAHGAALRFGGSTVVVLPQGLLTSPADLFVSALESGNVLLVSEFRPDLPWETFAAVTRNATISAMARMVCVIEPKKTGGSVRTARVALGQGKRVLVHCQDEFRAVGESLCEGGARPLPVRGGALDRERFLELWHSAPEPQPAQRDLFRE